MLAVAQNVGMQVNQRGQFKELIVGSGARLLKANNEGAFLGGTTYSTAPLKLSYDGNIYGNGSITLGTNPGFSLKIAGDGVLYFYANSTLTGKMGVLGSKDMYFESSASGDMYFAQPTAQYLRIIGDPQAGEILGDMQLRQSTGRITWVSLGAKIAAENSSIDIIGGDLKIPSNKAFYRGTDGGDTNTINYKDHSGNNATATVKGGIVTSCT